MMGEPVIEKSFDLDFGVQKVGKTTEGGNRGRVGKVETPGSGGTCGRGAVDFGVGQW
jgi:hypothetical protein